MTFFEKKKKKKMKLFMKPVWTTVWYNFILKIKFFDDTSAPALCKFISTSIRSFASTSWSKYFLSRRFGINASIKGRESEKATREH